MSYARDLPVLAAHGAMAHATPLMPQDETLPGLSLSQLAAILWSYRAYSLLIAAGVMVLVAIACWIWPRSYQATATLMVNFEVNDPLGGHEFPIGLLSSYMATQVELAHGSEVLLPVVSRLGLADDRQYSAGYPGESAGLADWVVTRVQKNLIIEQGRYGSQLLYVNYRADDPKRAAQVANAVAEVYSEQQYARLTGPASERAQRYTEQLSDLKDKVIVAQQQVTDYRQRSGLIDSNAKNDLDLQLMSTLEQRLLDAQNQKRVAQARSASDSAVGSQVLGSTMVQSLKTQLALQSAQMAQLRATLGPRHPQVLELQSQMAQSRRSLGAELDAYSGNARAELISATELEAKLQAAVDQQRASVVSVRQLQDDGAKYQLELESAQSVYKRALDGYDQVMFASAGGYRNVDFVSRAVAPAKPSKPKIRVMLMLGALLAVGLGVALPLIYELLHRRIRCRDDMERDLGIPVLVELGPLSTHGDVGALV
ncbi:Uncharacterized protein involved in exopolysaccharide biosynthesis [Hydrocarboniphaga daqingensis]|uniref:Uncharacterized protein involved in exopolysaccharide biosynthesis n=1 Tax=Hydrocarboniphaga daqingensis TaxID=490188 RepID=A0A1M5PAH2_9GAMM|nr:GNVR domain-containing protein [Hydrocarboniphaga daqingensis]SHG98776.1 Uncharacterized protein involved in exopolysaccharide biosynthesis [Hydrocarboniphaga daqingensis]